MQNRFFSAIYYVLLRKSGTCSHFGTDFCVKSNSVFVKFLKISFVSQSDSYLNLSEQLTKLLQAHRHLFRQERVFQRVALLVVAELVVFARHTITQLLMGMGLTQSDSVDPNFIIKVQQRP